MKNKILTLSILTLSLLITGCGDKEKKKSLTEGGMKCGAGKCGASMVDGSAVLVKKKINILDQLREDDTRRECVIASTTTKALYDCVRVDKTGRLSTKCSTDNVRKKEKEANETMKCETGKCTSGKDLPKK